MRKPRMIGISLGIGIFLVAFGLALGATVW